MGCNLNPDATIKMSNMAAFTLESVTSNYFINSKKMTVLAIFIVSALIPAASSMTCSEDTILGTREFNCPRFLDSSDEVYCCGSERNRKCCDYDELQNIGLFHRMSSTQFDELLCLMGPKTRYTLEEFHFCWEKIIYDSPLTSHWASVPSETPSHPRLIRDWHKSSIQIGLECSAPVGVGLLIFGIMVVVVVVVICCLCCSFCPLAKRRARSRQGLVIVSAQQPQLVQPPPQMQGYPMANPPQYPAPPPQYPAAPPYSQQAYAPGFIAQSNYPAPPPGSYPPPPGSYPPPPDHYPPHGEYPSAPPSYPGNAPQYAPPPQYPQ
ncbi:hypothetical protein GQR58_010946 [Nymphon striatum]|nr:hypothetical protein GQR58_010946 [Nymphon striatum]